MSAGRPVGALKDRGAQVPVATNLGQPRRCPNAPILAKYARALVPEGVVTLTRSRRQVRQDRTWHTGLRGEAGQPTVRTRRDPLAHRLHTTAQVLGYPDRGEY